MTTATRTAFAAALLLAATALPTSAAATPGTPPTWTVDCPPAPRT